MTAGCCLGCGAVTVKDHIGAWVIRHDKDCPDGVLVCGETRDADGIGAYSPHPSTALGRGDADRLESPASPRSSAHSLPSRARAGEPSPPFQGSPAAPSAAVRVHQVSRSPETPARGADRPVFPSFGGANKVGTDSGHNS